MPIIIDGWNLIRNEKSIVDDTDCDSIESARVLISHLDGFQKTHPDPIVLVFDSTNEYLEIEYTNTARLKIVPAKDADAYIRKFIDDVPDRQRANLRVVSSDRDVYLYAGRCRAVPVKSEDFWDKIKGSLTRRARSDKI